MGLNVNIPPVSPIITAVAPSQVGVNEKAALLDGSTVKVCVVPGLQAPAIS